MSVVAPLSIRFGRAQSGDGSGTEALEWLVTNGIGGFASGTISGIRTRRYHGLLVAALDPPGRRTVLVTDVHETLCIDGLPVPLHASRWHDETVHPQGFNHLEAFWLEGTVPVWRYGLGVTCLEKRVSMGHERNTTVVSYRLVRARETVPLCVNVLATHRDFHATTSQHSLHLEVQQDGRGIQVCSESGAAPLRLVSEGMTLAPAKIWYEGFLLHEERERGQNDQDDALHVATATAELQPGSEVFLVFSTEPDDVAPRALIAEMKEHEGKILASFDGRQGASADAVGTRLALAADQFVVRRAAGGHLGTSIIAGYHWFGDWGRDTMIALPGLTLATGRPELARDILVTYASYVDGGMLPNHFPERGGTPEYNTADATLWYIEAVRAYIEVTADLAVLDGLWPVLEQIVTAHEQGTRYGIMVDPADGLLRAGAPGLQLTWMDAKVGDWVVTPRQGKCVELNALWYNGLIALAELAVRCGRNGEPWQQRSDRVRTAMQRFWDPGRGYLADVLDTPLGDDWSLRPNQLFAVSLPASPLERVQQRAVVDACARSLVTSHGLRSLAPDHPAYRPRYEGDVVSRDGAYHQGTVWAWLLGPFALAHARVYRDPGVARSFLEPLVDQLFTYGLGSIGEIFDGDAPYRPRGCIAQAWSVAELLRAWTTLSTSHAAPLT